MEKKRGKRYLVVGSTVILVIAIVSFVLSAPPATWNRIYGGIGLEEAYSMRQTTDGDFIFLGQTYSIGTGGADFWLVKTDPDGIVLWEKSYGGELNDIGRAVRQTRDGGFILVGTTSSKGGGGSDIWLIKVSTSGAVIWDRTYGGRGDERGFSVEQTTGGGFIIVGSTRSKGKGLLDAWLVKVSSDGALEWDVTFGGRAEDVGHSVQQTIDGGYAFLGYTRSKGAGRADFWLVRTNRSGELLWEKTYGGMSDDFGYSLQTLTDNGFILLGDSESEGAGGMDYRLIRVNSTGTAQWDRAYGGTTDDWSYSVQQTKDGGFILCGHTWSQGAGRADAWLVKTNASGVMQWQQTVGTATLDYGRVARQTQQGDYVFVGYTTSYDAQGASDGWLVRLTSAGKQ